LVKLTVTVVAGRVHPVVTSCGERAPVAHEDAPQSIPGLPRR